jgi:opacity protein-like surface antigen
MKAAAKSFALFCLLLLTPFAAQAQNDEEYRMEIGGGAGMVSYEGDFNGSITSNMQPMGSLLIRRIISPYMALRANVSCGKLSGDSRDAKTYYPQLADNPVKFSNNLVDVGVTYEYNFWPYGTGFDYRGAQRLTPYIMIGIGGTFAGGDSDHVFTANIPVGAGLKYKVTDRLNLGLEWAAHFSLSDKLDGVEDPYTIKSSGLFKNNDCYTALQLTLTYSFMPKCRTCHNEDE